MPKPPSGNRDNDGKITMRVEESSLRILREQREEMLAG